MKGTMDEVEGTESDDGGERKESVEEDTKKKNRKGERTQRIKGGRKKVHRASAPMIAFTAIPHEKHKEVFQAKRPKRPYTKGVNSHARDTCGVTGWV
jgi:hypothetical protein